jgi:hypothetical protein
MNHKEKENLDQNRTPAQAGFPEEGNRRSAPIISGKAYEFEGLLITPLYKEGKEYGFTVRGAPRQGDRRIGRRQTNKK